MKTKSYTTFFIRSSELSGADLSQKLPIQGHRSWNRGDHRPTGRGPGKLEKRNGWLLESTLLTSAAIVDQIREVVQLIQPHLTTLNQIRSHCDILLSCAVYCEKEPPLYFEASVVQDIASLGCDFDLDIYVFNDSDTDD